jgi:N-acetylmuramoyl-L-alanine amidase
MLRLFVVFLLLALSLSALSDKEILKRADNFMKGSNKSNKFRAYNDYKNLYLRAIMVENNKLRLSSLKGIVKSGKALHIDVSSYADELKIAQPRTSHKVIKKPIVKKKKPKKNLFIKPKDNKHNIKVTSSHKLVSVSWMDDKLVLKFDKQLSLKQMNYFTLYDKEKKSYKYIFDIHASMLTKSQKLRKNGIKRIKLAQFNSNTLRLVIENDKKINVRFKRELSKVIIAMGKGSFKSTKTVSPKRLDRDKVIVIDAGHGGDDPGAVGYRNYREKVVVLRIAKELRRVLKSRGYRVYMTRDSDKFIKLSNRTKYAKRKHADIFVSIHANASPKKKAHGVECYFLQRSRSERAKRVAAKENSRNTREMNSYGKYSFLNTLNSHNIVASNKLAIDLQRGMLGILNKRYSDVRDGGVRGGPFWVLVGAQMPSVLVEVGFITNSVEAKRLVKSSYQKKIALGLANGIENYFINN